jgi:hypothetical protein
MDGGGEFRNGTGFILKGLFKNNLYNHDNKLFLNPCNVEEFNKQIVSNSLKHSIKSEVSAKDVADRIRLYRVGNISDF